MVLGFLAGVKYKGKIYFSATNTNGLFCFDVSCNNTELITVFKEEKNEIFLHNRAFLCGNKMWLIPAYARKIACVDLNTYDISYFDVPSSETSGCNLLFKNGFAFNSHIYMISDYLNNVVKIDTDDNNVLEVCKLNDCSKSNGNMILVDNDEIVIWGSGGNVKAKINRENSSIKEIDNGCLFTENDYNSFLYYNNMILFIPLGSDRIKAVLLQNKSERYISLPEKRNAFCHGLGTNEVAIMFPYENTREYVVCNWDSLEISMKDIGIGNDDNLVFDKIAGVKMQEISSDQGYWASSINGFVFEFSSKGDIINKYIIEMETDVLQNKLDTYYKENNVSIGFCGEGTNEIEGFGLEKLIDYISK